MNNTMKQKKKLNWRLYRNWLVAFGMWGVLAILVILVINSPYNLIWAIPLYSLGIVTPRVFRLAHPRAMNPLPLCYVRWAMLPESPRTKAAHLPQIDPTTIPNMTPISYASRDGLQLAGQFIAGNNRAIIVLVHGAGSNGENLLPQAIALHTHGYNVLLLDLRAHGRSEGDTSTLGSLETYDLLDAIEHVQSFEAVDADKIGVFGFSMGGQIALRAAAQSQVIRGVVADSPSPVTLEDYRHQRRNLLDWIIYPLNAYSIKVMSWMTGITATNGVLESIHNISPRPVLVISTGRGREQRWCNSVYRSAQEPKDIWEIPEALHGEGYKIYPTEYSNKLISFFNDAFFGYNNQPK